MTLLSQEGSLGHNCGSATNLKTLPPSPWGAVLALISLGEGLMEEAEVEPCSTSLSRPGPGEDKAQPVLSNSGATEGGCLVARLSPPRCPPAQQPAPSHAPI